MFKGRIFIDGIIVLNFLVEEVICTEDAECNLRGGRLAGICFLVLSTWDR